MINILGKLNDAPYKKFYHYFSKAKNMSQESIDAVLISSFNKDTNEVNSRYVNIKYIDNNQWIFFTNYNSLKSKEFQGHDQIAATIFWNKINIQIRIKAKIKKTKEEFSDQHFQNRNDKKNALSISSYQSKKIFSYEKVIEKYEKSLSDENKLSIRPSYWGGYTFTPYYFEFWEGNDFRLNKRIVYELKDSKWNNYFLEP